MAELKIESALPQIIELKMALEDGVANADKLIEQYTALIEVINELTEEKRKLFPANFVKDIEKEKEILKVKREDCLERLTYIRILLEDVNKDTPKGKQIIKLLSLIYASLGILANQQEKYQKTLNEIEFGKNEVIKEEPKEETKQDN